MVKYSIIVGIGLASGFFVAPLSAQAPAEVVPGLFDGDGLLEMSMPVNFETLCRPSENSDCDYFDTQLSYTDSVGEPQNISISIRRRDGWRAQQTNCQIPTLFVKVEDEASSGTLFESHDLLALTSHCGKGISPEIEPSRRLPDEFESYVINEYLGYRMFGLVSDAAIRVRLVRITYTDPENPRRDFTHYAFFSEHFETLFKRLSAQPVGAEQVNLSEIDATASAELSLFQFMVGNADWSVEQQDNVLLLGMSNGKQVPVLFDLDRSGLVDAHYATPPQDVPINSVRQRWFKGHCLEQDAWNALFARFEDLRGSFFELLSQTPGLGRGDRRISGTYLDSFYELLNSPERRQDEIINRCTPHS